MSECKCSGDHGYSCSDKEIGAKRNTRNLVYFVMVSSLIVVLCIILLLVTSKQREQERKIQSLTNRVNVQQENLIDTAKYLETVTVVMKNVSGILSNQTQAIKTLREMVEITSMSSGSPCNFDIPALPAMKEMQPSTNGVDVSKVFKNHPWACMFGVTR